MGADGCGGARVTGPVSLTFERDPAFQLDRLLELLALVPDGDDAQRATVQSLNGDTVQAEPGWDISAYGYGLTVQPQYRCGFAEHGDGKVLTIITQRLTDPFQRRGALRLSTVDLPRVPPKQGIHRGYSSTEWVARVSLRSETGWRRGRGQSMHPGTAALLAYLRAWGVLA